MPTDIDFSSPEKPLGKVSGAALMRLQKELQDFVSSSPAGLELDEETLAGADLGVWRVKMTGQVDTLYEGEKFTLQFKFNEKYPHDSPEVMFVGPLDTIPVHKHVYSNGHICLSILAQGHWSPAFTVESVCHSILSMLGLFINYFKIDFTHLLMSLILVTLMINDY